MLRARRLTLTVTNALCQGTGPRAIPAGKAGSPSDCRHQKISQGWTNGWRWQESGGRAAQEKDDKPLEPGIGRSEKPRPWTNNLRKKHVPARRALSPCCSSRLLYSHAPAILGSSFAYLLLPHVLQDATKIMAKDLVRTRAHIKKMIMMKTQIQAVSLKIQVPLPAPPLEIKSTGCERGTAEPNKGKEKAKGKGRWGGKKQWEG